MKRPFPIHSTKTISRANVRVALLKFPETLTSAEAVADHFCGVGEGGLHFAKQRHINRCRRLMHTCQYHPSTSPSLNQVAVQST